MRAEVLAFCRENQLFSPGDRVICALSGGADSMAMLWCLRSLEDALSISVSAAHFNHGLRGAESDRDEAFVRDFCQGFGIPLFCGQGEVTPGNKGLEAAAREARYAYLLALDPQAKIATAHTADDNAETFLMHLLRGTSLRGLGGIPPIRDRIVRPLLSVTRKDVLSYLQELGLPHVEDSSNHTDRFLRNRLRRQVLPLLRRENPEFSKNITPLAARLRQDEDFLSSAAEEALKTARLSDGLSCGALRGLHPAVLRRVLSLYLRSLGLPEPESQHITQVQALLFSQNPSAQADLPGGLRLCRAYDTLAPQALNQPGFSPVILAVPGQTAILDLGLVVCCTEETACPGAKSAPTEFLLNAASLSGPLVARPRQPGDQISLPGGTKSLKALFIDRKIPAGLRSAIPVLSDGRGVAAVYSIGPDQSRLSIPGEKALRISIYKTERS